MAYPEIIGISISVDNNEWYYGRPEHRSDPNKRILIKNVVPENLVVSPHHANEINEYFLWTNEHERDTAKKKKRPFYVDKSFFVNPNITVV